MHNVTTFTRATLASLNLATCAVLSACSTSPPVIPSSDQSTKVIAPTTTTSPQHPAIPAASITPTAAASTIAPPPVQAPTLEWARRWGSYGSDNVNRHVAGTDGTWILAGGYQFEIDLGGKKLAGESELQSNGGLFVAGFAPDGQLRWTTDFHGKANENITDMVRGPDETIVFTGGFRDLNAGCGRIRSKEWDDVLIGSLATDGHCRWTHGHGVKGNDGGQAIAVDGAGNVTIFGTMQSGTNFGGGAIDTGGKPGVFAASFTADGKHRWSRSLWSQSFAFATAAAADANGSVYVTLRFEGTVDLGDGPRTSHGGGDVALLALASDGRLSWSTSLGGPDSDAVDAIAVDPRSGDVVLAGAYSVALDLGRDQLTSAGGADGFVARFDKTGQPKWARGFGGAEHDRLNRIALDGAGNVYVIGQMRGSFIVDTNTLTSVGEADILVASVSPDGTHRWALSFGGPEYDDANGLLVEPSGRILVAGSFASTIMFGTTKLKSAGSYDIFVAAWRP